jgi:malate dehydrogenase
MVKAILRDDKKVLPASVLLEGEYGLDNLCIGVPIVLGDSGVEKVLEITLTDEERNMLHDSAETYREFLKIIGY